MVTRAKLTLDTDQNQVQRPDHPEVPEAAEKKIADPKKKSGKAAFLLTAGLTIVSLLLFKRKIF